MKRALEKTLKKINNLSDRYRSSIYITATAENTNIFLKLVCLDMIEAELENNIFKISITKKGYTYFDVKLDERQKFLKEHLFKFVWGFVTGVVLGVVLAPSIDILRQTILQLFRG